MKVEKWTHGRAHPTPQAGCRACELALADPRLRVLWGHGPDFGRPAKAPRPECVHLGGLTGETAECPRCPNNTASENRVPLYACAVHGTTTHKRGAPGRKSCHGCKEYQAPTLAPPASPQALWPIRFDETNLAPGKQGKRFNPSLIAWEGAYLLAYRDGWRGSQIWLQRLDRAFVPVGDAVQLELFHPREGNYGREDPRAFMFRGQLHIAYIGVVGPRVIRHTSVLYARINNDTLKVEQIFYPHYEKRNSWEKSWSMFEHENELYAVYSIAPHRILHIDGERAEMAYETPSPLPWKPGTEMRGGASPLLIGDEWWSFFHSRTEHPRRTYMAGVYCFDSKPPFRITRFCPEPIMTADWATNTENYCAVVFPCGAVLVKG